MITPHRRTCRSSGGKNHPAAVYALTLHPGQWADISVRTDRHDLSVPDPEGLTADFSTFSCLKQVTAVRDSVKSMSYAVGICDILHEPHPVNNVVFYGIIMREYIVFGQSKARDKPFIGWINSFSRKFRLGVYNPGTVHGPGADAHNDPVISVESVRKTDLFEEGIFRRDMSASKYDKIIAVKSIRFFLTVSGIADIHA